LVSCRIREPFVDLLGVGPLLFLNRKTEKPGHGEIWTVDMPLLLPVIFQADVHMPSLLGVGGAACGVLLGACVKMLV